MLHTNLPIYKVAYDLLNTITDLAKNMPRDFKMSIGGKLRDECVDIVVLIFRANVATEKAPHLGALIERLQVAELEKLYPVGTEVRVWLMHGQQSPSCGTVTGHTGGTFGEVIVRLESRTMQVRRVAVSEIVL